LHRHPWSSRVSLATKAIPQNELHFRHFRGHLTILFLQGQE